LAKYDYGGGCPCGLYRECIPQCENHHPSILDAAKKEQEKRKKAKMSWDDVGPNHCNMDGTPIIRDTRTRKETKMQEHDFGFTFANEDDFTKVERVVDQEKLKQLRDMIMPLLLNLKKNPEKDIIQWPGKDRIKSVDAFIKKMDKLLLD